MYSRNMKNVVNYYSKNVRSFPEINKEKNPWFFRPSYIAPPHMSISLPSAEAHKEIPQKCGMSLVVYPEYHHFWMFYREI